jgi:small subunit ribosomal protein S1
MLQNKYLPEGSLIGTSENREYISSLHGLERARAEGKILEGVVAFCDSESYTMHIDLYGVDGIIEREEALLAPEIKDIAIITRVGKAVAFKVLQIINDDPSHPVAILSRKEAQRECIEQYLMDLIPGDIIPAKTTHFEPFGAFVDIGCGIPSLMSVDSISISRIPGPQERFFLREDISVVVKSIDYDNARIFVSTRELLGTWEENASKFAVGQTVSGIIRSVEEYGVFVELSPNLAGLAELKDGVEAGQGCAVYIKSIMPDKMKIKLVIIDTYEREERKKPLEYFINPEQTSHIDYWKYSPDSCRRIIETIF